MITDQQIEELLALSEKLDNIPYSQPMSVCLNSERLLHLSVTLAPHLARELQEARAEAERLQGVDLANRALCGWQKEAQAQVAAKDADSAALRLALECCIGSGEDEAGFPLWSEAVAKGKKALAATDAGKSLPNELAALRQQADDFEKELERHSTDRVNQRKELDALRLAYNELLEAAESVVEAIPVGSSVIHERYRRIQRLAEVARKGQAKEGR